MSRKRPISDCERILVVSKFRYLGDTIVATPLLRQLSEATNAQITLLAGPQIPDLLEGCPYLDEIWTVSGDRDGKIARTLALAQRIRDAGFGAAFLLNRSFHSAMVARVAGIERRIGFNTEHRGWLLTDPVPYDRQKPEIECYLDLLRAVKIPAIYRLPELWVSAAERARGRNPVTGSARSRSRPVVAIQPGAKDAYRKQWGAGRFADVIKGLPKHVPDVHLVLVGDSSEKAVCDDVERMAGIHVDNLAGKTGLREILGLLAETDLLIANDTAMVHAAVALGTRTVMIAGPQSVGKWSYGPPHCVVSYDTVNERMDRHANRRALDRITPESVLAVAVESLAKIGAPI